MEHLAHNAVRVERELVEGGRVIRNLRTRARPDRDGRRAYGCVGLKREHERQEAWAGTTYTLRPSTTVSAVGFDSTTTSELEMVRHSRLAPSGRAEEGGKGYVRRC